MISLFYRAMDVSDRTGIILDALEPRAQFINTLPEEVTSSLTELYGDISRGRRSLAKLRRAGKPMGNIVAVKEDIAKSLEGRFFPVEIRRHIAAHVKHLLVYKATVDGRPITIEFGLSEDQLGELEEYGGFVDFILLWLHVCGAYAKDTCAKSLTVRMFLTDFPKLLPAENRVTLGPVNVNTGYSYFCAPKGEIVLYRREEWKKVFIHETFHAYGLDFSCDSNKLISRVKKLFPVRSEHKVSEAYTETWARICNSAMCAYLCTSGRPTRATYMQNVLFNIGIERMYAAVQCRKVLAHMGLVYDSLVGDSDTNAVLRANLYKEDSNVLAYYVITAALLSDYPRFISWCRTNNTTLLRFRATDANWSSFAQMVEELAVSRGFLNLMKDIGPVKIPGMEESLTMSAVDGL